MKASEKKIIKQRNRDDSSRRLVTLIRERRLENGLSYAEVAKYLEISEKTYIAYETGTQPIPLHRVYALANCLNIKPKEIVDL